MTLVILLIYYFVDVISCQPVDPPTNPNSNQPGRNANVNPSRSNTGKRERLSKTCIFEVCGENKKLEELTQMETGQVVGMMDERYAQKTTALAVVAPLYIRSYIEHCTARLLAGNLGDDKGLLLKALSAEGIATPQQSDRDNNKLLAEIQTFLNKIRDLVMKNLGKEGPSDIQKAADEILADAINKIESRPEGFSLLQIRMLLEPAMKDSIRNKVGDYYTFWLFILKSEKLPEDPEVKAIKKLMTKHGIQSDEIFAREISSMWVRTSTFGVHTPGETTDISLNLLVQGMKLHKMCFPNTENVILVLFQFMTGEQ